MGYGKWSLVGSLYLITLDLPELLVYNYNFIGLPPVAFYKQINVLWESIMTLPIKPSELSALRCATVPDWVISVVNQLIVKNWNGRESIIKQSEIEFQYLGEDEFDFAWLDFEPIFRDAGWKVTYNKPAYYEAFEAFFTFSK